MSNVAMSREEFVLLVEEAMQEWREGEHRRLRVCARLSAEIAAIVDQPQHRGKGYREIAASLGVQQGTMLLELVDLLEEETRDYKQVKP